MRIISRVRIEGFRSLADEQLEDIGNHNVIVGKNSGGKSNILRALSLFFNGQPNPGALLEFTRDLHYRPSRKQKKEIRIEVEFQVPEKFKFRAGLERVKELGDKFSILKKWELDRQRNIKESTEIVVDEVVQDVDPQIARDFLSLIVFRYIPNRTVPAELLRDESQAIAGAIFKKLRESDKADDVLKGLSTSAKRLLESTADALSKSGAPISSPNIATADSLGEMLRMSGFQANGLNGSNVRDEDWGAGHQSFFLLNLLREIDTDYSRQFGWRQACVWAVEEPESGLHHDLQTRLSKQLMDWSSDDKRRLQIFTTTHSPIVAMSGDRGFWVELGETSTTVSRASTPELVRSAEERGVSTYIHPVLSFPFNPVVLVEGWIDERVLNHVAAKVGRGLIKFICLPTLDGDEGSGVDAQLAYVRKNASLIRRRPSEAPFMVLVDWEVPDTKFQQLRAAYGEGGTRYVLKPDAGIATRELGETFRGIERYYPAQVIRAAHAAGEIDVAFPEVDGRPWSVSRESLDRAKKNLSSRILALQDVAQMPSLHRLCEYVHGASVSYANEQLRLLGDA